VALALWTRWGHESRHCDASRRLDRFPRMGRRAATGHSRQDVRTGAALTKPCMMCGLDVALCECAPQRGDSGHPSGRAVPTGGAAHSRRSRGRRMQEVALRSPGIAVLCDHDSAARKVHSPWADDSHASGARQSPQCRSRSAPEGVEPLYDFNQRAGCVCAGLLRVAEEDPSAGVSIGGLSVVLPSQLPGPRSGILRS